MLYSQSPLERNWIDQLPDDLRTKIRGLMFERQFKKEEFIVETGERPSAIFEVVAGQVKLSKPMQNFKEVVMVFYAEGSILGEANTILDLEFSVNFIAKTDATLNCLSSTDFKSIREDHPEVSEVLLRRLSHSVLDLAESNLNKISLSLEERLATRLHKLAVRTGDATKDSDASEIHVKFSQDDLASMLGASRQKVNLYLRKWQAANILAIEYSGLRIYDLERLLEIGEIRLAHESLQDP